MTRQFQCALLLLCVYQLEDIVEDEVTASAVWEQLKHLRIIHRPLLFVNLSSRACQPFILLQQTLAPPGVGTFESELSIPVRLRSLPQVFHQFRSKVARPKWRLGAGLWRMEVSGHLIRSANDEQRGRHTVSFSIIPATPCTAAVSNVSIDVSRFILSLSSSYQAS